MIRLQDLTYRYPKAETPVLAGFSAAFQRGEISAVRGRNGCGKTTLTKLIAGILRPSSGSISIEGLDTSNMDLFDIGRQVGYIFQNPNRQLFCESVFGEVAFGLRNLGFDEDLTEREVMRYLEYFDLVRYRDVYPGKLSLGEKQRLALAAVLALGTDYLVLDEPTGGLDVRRQRELGDILSGLRKDLRCGIVIVSHEAGFIERYADRELVIAG